MKKHENWLRGRCFGILFCLITLLGKSSAFALVDSAALISVSVPAGTQVWPRTIFTQSWTLQNSGTTTWSPGENGYTLNLVGTDSLGAVPISATNSTSSWSVASATIGSAKSVAPGGEAVFTMNFIAPEAAGSFTDIFQLCNAGGVYFGPQVAIEIVVPSAGSTNQYDRARVISYANNYAHYVCSDGYCWTNGSSYGDYGAHAPVPTTGLGDDCAHFASSCIGSQAAQRGGGLYIPSRALPTYGEPGAGRLINTVLIAPGYATEVFSLSSMSPGDLIGWNWEGDTNIADLDHVCVYLGNGVVAAHSGSCLDVPATTWYQSSERNWVWHLVHIFDAPTIDVFKSGSKLVLSWGTNWNGYALYSATSLSPTATWNKVLGSPVVSGRLNRMTNTTPQSALFYRLALPATPNKL